MRISDWSSDVCSSDLPLWRAHHLFHLVTENRRAFPPKGKHPDGLGIGDIRPQPFADRHEPLALSMYLHVVLIVSVLYIDRDGDRPAHDCDHSGDDFYGTDRDRKRDG